MATDACVSDLLFLVPLPFSEAGHQSLSPSPFRPLLSSFFPGHFISISALAPLSPPQGKGEGKVSSLSSLSLAGSWPPRGDQRLSIPLCSLFAPPPDSCEMLSGFGSCGGGDLGLANINKSRRGEPPSPPLDPRSHPSSALPSRHLPLMIQRGGRSPFQQARPPAAALLPIAMKGGGGKKFHRRSPTMPATLATYWLPRPC